MHKDVPFRWMPECTEAFEKLKALLTFAPILAHLRPDETFILDTDASNNGIDTVLSQVIAGRESHGLCQQNHACVGMVL